MDLRYLGESPTFSESHKPKWHAIKGIRAFKKARKRVLVPPGVLFTIQPVPFHFHFNGEKAQKNTFLTPLETLLQYFCLKTNGFPRLVGSSERKV